MTSKSGRKAWAVILVCLAAVTFSACSRSPRVSFYTLDAGSKVAPVDMVSWSYPVAIGPITLPDLVDRPQFVIRAEGSQVEILELHRWAEPLKSQIPRLLAENLGRQIGSDRVSAYPQHASVDAECRVQVDFQRFESSAGGIVVEALWSVRNSSDPSLKTGRSQIREAVREGGYDAVVAAYSRALAVLSNDIALSIMKGKGQGR